MGLSSFFTKSKQVDSRPFIYIYGMTPLQPSDINNNHNSRVRTRVHSRTQRHGGLLKWNRQSLTFTSVRPYSFDRERIQTEWNPHQHGSCVIDLSSPLTDWQNENWKRGCLAWTQPQYFCLYAGLPEGHRGADGETERKKRNQKWQGSE